MQPSAHVFVALKESEKTHETLPRYSFTAFFTIVRFFVFSLNDFLTAWSEDMLSEGH